MAFCHKIVATLDKASVNALQCSSAEKDVSNLPDLNQPVLLEVQSVSVLGVMAKIMFDNGSTAALITHLFFGV